MTRRYLILALFGIFCFLAQTTAAQSLLVFQGKVLGGDGQPVAGAEIYVFDSANVKRPADYISEKTAEDGQFSMQLPPGRYWTMAVQRMDGVSFGPLSPKDRYSGTPLVFEGIAGQEVENDFTVMELKEAALLNHKRNDELIRVTGRILDSQDRPVAGAFAMADLLPRVEWPSYVSTWTEDDGRYTIFLPRGKIFIGAGGIFSSNNDYHLGRQVDFTTDAVGVDLSIVDAVAEGVAGPGTVQ